MNATLLLKWKKNSLKILYTFFQCSENPGTSFFFFMPVGFAEIMLVSPFFVNGHSPGQSAFRFSMLPAPG